MFVCVGCLLFNLLVGNASFWSVCLFVLFVLCLFFFVKSAPFWSVCLFVFILFVRNPPLWSGCVCLCWLFVVCFVYLFVEFSSTYLLTEKR